MFRLKHLALGLPLKLLSRELGDERCVFTSLPLLAKRRPPPSPLEQQGSPLPKRKILLKAKPTSTQKPGQGTAWEGVSLLMLTHLLGGAAGWPAEAVGRSVIQSCSR